eukprot:scaffold87_cov388-Prasinococcus_capsulatus_cf.AAC.4
MSPVADRLLRGIRDLLGPSDTQITDFGHCRDIAEASGPSERVQRVFTGGTTGFASETTDI